MALRSASAGTTDVELFQYFYEREKQAEAVKRQRTVLVDVVGRLLIVGEFVAGNKGLGALLVISMGTFSTPLMYATMVVLTALALGVYIGAQWLERKALERYNLAPPGA